LATEVYRGYRGIAGNLRERNKWIQKKMTKNAESAVFIFCISAIL
jgi:hypothetical protein